LHGLIKALKVGTLAEVQQREITINHQGQFIEMQNMVIVSMK